MNQKLNKNYIKKFPQKTVNVHDSGSAVRAGHRSDREHLPHFQVINSDVSALHGVDVDRSGRILQVRNQEQPIGRRQPGRLHRERSGTNGHGAADPSATECARTGPRVPPSRSVRPRPCRVSNMGRLNSFPQSSSNKRAVWGSTGFQRTPNRTRKVEICDLLKPLTVK